MTNRYKKTFESHKKILQTLPLINTIVKNQNIQLPSFRIYTNPYRDVSPTKYAYATILFLGEKYVPSILTLAMSLREVKSKYNLVCLVQDKSYPLSDGSTSSISQKTLDNLFKIYDYVIGCDLLQIPNYQIPKSHFTQNKHYKYIQYYVTKLNVLGLTQYEKIFYLDASSMITRNLDSVFQKYDQSAFFDDQEFQYSQVGLRGTFFLLVTNPLFFKKAIYLIQNYHLYFKDYYFCRGVDEVILYYSIYPYWSDTFLDFNLACDGNNLSNLKKQCDIFYFQIRKPFEPILNYPQNVLKRFYLNYQRWDDMVRILLREYPQYKEYYKNIKKYRPTTF